jgi:hypothetical protein
MDAKGVVKPILLELRAPAVGNESLDMGNGVRLLIDLKTSP